MDTIVLAGLKQIATYADNISIDTLRNHIENGLKVKKIAGIVYSTKIHVNQYFYNEVDKNGLDNKKT